MSHGSTSETLQQHVTGAEVKKSIEDEFDFDAFKTNKPVANLDDLFDFNVQKEE